MKKAYLIEVGVLLTQKDPEWKSYNRVYDKQWGYYDEDQYFTLPTGNEKMERLKEEVYSYVRNGMPLTYGIISATMVDDSVTEEQCELRSVSLENEEYKKEDVLFSVMKDANGIIKSIF